MAATRSKRKRTRVDEAEHSRAEGERIALDEEQNEQPEKEAVEEIPAEKPTGAPFTDIQSTLAPYDFDSFDPKIEECVTAKELEKLLMYADGRIPSWGPCVKKWIKCDKVVTICYFDGHFATLVIELKKQQIVIHDPLAYKFTESDINMRRCVFLLMARLIPQVMKLIGYFKIHNIINPAYGQWDICFGAASGKDAYQQIDEADCAIYCLKFVERFISTDNIPKGLGNNSQISGYRYEVARTIYAHSTSDITVENLLEMDAHSS